MKRVLIASLLLLPTLPAQALQHHLLIISGIGGIDSYRQQFARASTSLAQAALEAGIEPHNIIVLAAEPAPDLIRGKGGNQVAWTASSVVTKQALCRS